jgi:hypothetical protein
MNVATSLQADSGTPEVLQPRMRAPDDPAHFPTTAAVGFSASGNAGGDAALVENLLASVVIATTNRADGLGRFSG